MAMSPRLLRPRASGAHPDAADWRTRVVANGGSVSSSTFRAVDVFCRSIESAGLRDRFFRLNLFAGTGLSAALVPLFRGPSLGGTQFGNATDTNNNFVSGDYVETGASGGIKGNGTNKRLDTGIAGSALSPGNRHVSAYDIINATSDYSPSVLSGSANATQHGIGPWVSAATYAYRTHNAVGGNASATKNLGLWLGSDTSATASVLYRNGSSVASTSGQSAGGSGNSNYNILGNAAGEWSEAALGGYSIGLSMTAGQVSSYYTAMQAFQSALFRDRPSSDPAFAAVTNAEAKLWIDNVYANGGTVSTATAAAVNTFATSIESAGLRDRFYRLNLFAGSNLSAALVPLYRGPSLGGTQFGSATDTNNNFVSGDYVETGASGGLLGNGSTKYLNTGLAGSSLTFGNAHLSGYIVTPPSSGTYVSAVGALTALNSDEFALNCNQNVTATTTPFFSEENTAGGFVAAAVNNPNGFLVGASTSSTDRRFYRNGSQSGSTVTTALARSQYSNLPLFVMARNFTSSPTGYNNGRMAAYSIGAGMTAGQVSSYYTAMQAFQTAMSRNA